MTTQPPKFAELVKAYSRAVSVYTDEKADLDKQTQALQQTANAMDQRRTELVDAMKTSGVQSIRQSVWDKQYFYLNDAGTIETRTVASAEELDRQLIEETA